MKIRYILLGMLGAALAAQTPARPFDELKTYLNLTDAQVQQLRELRQQQAQSLQSIHGQIRQKQESLRTLLGTTGADPAAVGRQMLEIEALRKQVSDAQTSLRTQAVNILTAEQRAKLTALEEARKLQPAIGQATGLGLLTPPEGGPTWGGPGGPGLRGFGFGGPGPMGARIQRR